MTSGKPRILVLDGVAVAKPTLWLTHMSHSAHAIPVMAGKDCRWCACSRSRDLAWCDGYHPAPAEQPVRFTAECSEIVWLRGCLNTNSQSFCDGTHARSKETS
jgi:CDGSH-type Zn-finger protein